MAPDPAPARQRESAEERAARADAASGRRYRAAAVHIIDAAGQVAERAAGQVVEAAGQAADVAGHAAGQAAERASAVAERAVAHVPRWTPAPPNASAIEYHNYLVTQRESFAMGVINASAPFLPVFVARLGGSDFDVGLLTALPALAGLVFAIPAAGYLRARRNVVPVFATSRLLASLAYVATAIATLIVPTPWVVPAVLGVWLVATIPGTVGMVAFAVVMDGAAGPRGRYDLLSRRWSIMGLTTAISVVVIGQILQALMFPMITSWCSWVSPSPAISLVGFALFALDRPSAKGDGGGLTQRQATGAGRAVSGEA